MVAILVSLALTLILGPFTLILLRRVQAIQKISEFVPEHQVKQGTPTMGGIMMLAAILGTLVIAGFRWVDVTDSWMQFIWLMLGFAAIGFLDDYVMPRVTGKRGLGWMPKLALQFAVALPTCYSYFGPAPVIETAAGYIPLLVLHPQGWGYMWMYAVIIVGMANAFNLTDGLDGLAAGTMSLAALGIFLVGAPALYAGSILGACLGFLVFNAPPAKVFMGDVGSLPIGACFAFALLDQQHVSPWAILLCGVFLIELIPVPIQIASVKLFKRRVFPRTPIHHAFQQKGIAEKKITSGFVLAQALCTIGYVVMAR